MINLVKKENINLGILETDFDIFLDIVNTFNSDSFKQDCILDLDDYTLPEYFKDKITIVLQTNEMLIGYVIFKFKNNTEVEINRLCVLDEFKNKMMEVLLAESVIYIAGEVGIRNVIVLANETDQATYTAYKSIGFYNSNSEKLLSVNVPSVILSRKLNDKFRNIEDDAVDYKSLKIVNKIASGRSGNIYLTEDKKILKMFTSTSFTYIKDREETLRYLKNIDIDGIIKPKHLVYYEGVFAGYIMDYLPEGDVLLKKAYSYNFEEKIEKIKKLEKLIKNLHSKKIYVCDLNPDNIYIDNNGEIKLIDCDAFIVKKNVVNNNVAKKYQDPVYKLVSAKTDMYAFAITSLELLINQKINDNATLQDIEKIYNKNKNKLPSSFKTYFEGMFKTKERYYFSDSYENYINYIYNVDSELDDDKKGNISIIILSVLLLVVAVIGYLVFKFR